MKNLALFGSAAALTLAIAASVGCGASGCSQGGTNLNTNTTNPTVPLQCGTGTYYDPTTHQCLVNK